MYNERAALGLLIGGSHVFQPVPIREASVGAARLPGITTSRIRHGTRECVCHSQLQPVLTRHPWAELLPPWSAPSAAAFGLISGMWGRPSPPVWQGVDIPRPGMPLIVMNATVLQRQPGAPHSQVGGQTSSSETGGEPIGWLWLADPIHGHRWCLRLHEVGPPDAAFAAVARSLLDGAVAWWQLLDAEARTRSITASTAAGSVQPPPAPSSSGLPRSPRSRQTCAVALQTTVCSDSRWHVASDMQAAGTCGSVQPRTLTVFICWERAAPTVA